MEVEHIKKFLKIFLPVVGLAVIAFSVYSAITLNERRATQSNVTQQSDSTQAGVTHETLQDKTTQNSKSESSQVSSDKYNSDKANRVYSLESNDKSRIKMTFAGDINLADDWNNMEHFYTTNGISDCISSDLIEIMQAADIMFINNEFAFSDRGDRQTSKPYTFRAKTSNVSILKELGVDAVSLANNHIYDFREQALLDTLETLDKAGIAHSGAGANLKQAMEPARFVINGMKISMVSASRSESYFNTPVAGKNTSGILDAYGSENCINAIKSADKNSDFVVVKVHWGTEGSHNLDEMQRKNAKKYIDAGADVVIGSHPHVLQGMEFYKGKLIAYSLGNFWFNMKTLDSGVITVEIDKNKKAEYTFVPCIQSGGQTKIVTDEKEKRRITNLIEDVSPSRKITIDTSGKISEKQ